MPTPPKGTPEYEEWRRKNSEAKKGKPLSAEHRAKLSAAHKGKPKSEEWKRKMSELQKGRKRPEMAGEKNPMWGKTHSDETRAKISASLIDRAASWVTDEYRQKLSEAQRRRFDRDGHPMQGRKHSDATRAKMRESHLGENAYWFGKSLPPDVRQAIVERAVEMAAEHRGMWSPEAIARSAAARFPEPNHKEQELFQLLPDSYRYTGDGSVVIERKIPDFADVERRKAIELYGDHWHTPEQAEERVELFARYGWQVLIVWESELQDIATLRDKLTGFIEAKE